MTKRSILWAGIAVSGLLVAGMYLVLQSWTSRTGVEPAGVGASGWLAFCSAAVAIVVSIWLTHRLVQRLLTAQRSTAISVTAYILTVISFPFALFLGLTIGGTLGGAWGDRLIGPAGAVIGLGVGMFGITMFVAGTAAVVGYLLGNLITKLLQPQRS